MSNPRYHELTVNLCEEQGRIKALNGVNLGPITMNGFMDLSEWHRQLKIPYTRLHDCPYAVPETVDVHSIFPRFDADVDDPANYNFDMSDDYIQSILDVGSGIVYRLGETIEHYRRRKYFVHPPKDYERWTKICINIIRHYNEGWADGFHHNIKYWEIWNEPWVRPYCWTGTDEEWFALYRTASRMIKEYDPSLLIGGPTAMGWFPNDFATAFLDLCEKEKLPLDFYSWHFYADHPSLLLESACKIREELDRRGFTNTESHLNEWNYHPHQDWTFQQELHNWGKDVFIETQDEHGAAFDAATLIGMHDAHVDVGNFYWAKEGWWGLFDHWGAPQKNYYAFLAFARMLDTPLRVKAEGTDQKKGVAILAGRSEDKQEAQIMVSHFRAEHEVVGITLEDTPWEGGTRFEVSLVDKEHDLTITNRGKVGEGNFFGPLGGNRLAVRLPAHAVALIRMFPLEK